jgi:hypothetical protein
MGTIRRECLDSVVHSGKNICGKFSASGKSITITDARHTKVSQHLAGSRFLGARYWNVYCSLPPPPRQRADFSGIADAEEISAAKFVATDVGRDYDAHAGGSNRKFPINGWIASRV